MKRIITFLLAAVAVVTTFAATVTQPENGQAYYIQTGSQGIMYATAPATASGGQLSAQYLSASLKARQLWTAVENTDGTWSFIATVGGEKLTMAFDPDLDAGGSRPGAMVAYANPASDMRTRFQIVMSGDESFAGIKVNDLETTDRSCMNCHGGQDAGTYYGAYNLENAGSQILFVPESDNPSQGGDDKPSDNEQDSSLPNNVPRMDITLLNGDSIIKDKTTWVDATVKIDGKGQWDGMDETSIRIRGRGNSSWSAPSYSYVYDDDNSGWGYGGWGGGGWGGHYEWTNPKNPYRIKFDSKVKVMGMKKGKNWVLLANKQRRSLLTNAFGMKVARLCGTLAANKVRPVDLYINGKYRGQYNVTEKVGVSNNSIDIKDETNCALVEWDTYHNDEPENMFYHRYGSSRRMPVSIKYPDQTDTGDTTNLTKDQIEESVGDLIDQVYAGGDLSSVLDLDMTARYVMCTELIGNQEMLHPKSTYLFRENLNSDTSKWVFGPIWDLDWAYGYEEQGNYGTVSYRYDFWSANSSNFENLEFWNALRNNDGFKQAYEKVWGEFTLNHSVDSLLDWCHDYYQLVRSSIALDDAKWQHSDSYGTVYQNMTTWLKNRAEYLAQLYAPNVVDGIQSVSQQPAYTGRYDVYGIDGRLVGRQLDHNAIHSLPRGIYVIQGKKFVVR